MNEPKQIHDAEDQAALWAARLRSGNLSPVLRSELNEWLRLDPDHGKLLDDYCETSANFDAAIVVAQAEGRLRTPARPRMNRRTWIGGLAAAAVVAVAAVSLWPARPLELRTPPAERRAFTLADGSVIELSANTRAIVTLGHFERKVTLGNGEALFSVAKDPQRPFAVTTRHGVVRVTGTKFNVRADTRDNEEVTVLEGTVNVAAAEAAAPVALRPGQQAMFYGNEPKVKLLTEAQLRRVTAWRKGRVEFEAEPLRSALERVAAYNGRQVEVSPALDGLALGGQYDLADFDAILEAIETILPVQVMREGDKVRVVPR